MSNFLTNLLQLPHPAQKQTPFPKSFFSKQGYPLTAVEKRLLKTPNLPLASEWTGSLKPTAGNVPTYGEGPDRYTEIQYFRLSLKEVDYDKHATNLARLYHRYLPFPLLLTLHTDTRYQLSAATKHIPTTKGSSCTSLIEFTSPAASLIAPSPPQSSFQQAIAFPNLTTLHLKTVYDDYLSAIVAFNWQHPHGTVTAVTNPHQSQELLEERRRLEKEHDRLTRELRKTSRMPERVALQTQLNKVRSSLEKLINP
jgi:hypothetical protein